MTGFVQILLTQLFPQIDYFFLICFVCSYIFHAVVADQVTLWSDKVQAAMK